MRYNLVLGCSGLGMALCVACSDSLSMGTVLEDPVRFSESEIVLNGMATNIDSDSLGTGGYYLLQEAGGAVTALNQIRVRSNYLPSPGGEYTVSGRLVTDPDQPGSLLFLESSRSGSPDWLLLVILAGAMMAGLLFVLLAATVVGSKTLLNAEVPPTQRALFDPGDALSSYHARWKPMKPHQNGAHHGNHAAIAVAAGPIVDKPVITKKTVPFNYLGAELEVIEGPDKGRKFPVAASPLFIGRAGERNNHVVLTDDTVSMAHATILRNGKDHSFSLINDSQTNQAWVNHAPIQDCVLTNGSWIRLGATVLVFHQHSTNGHAKRPQPVRVKPGGSA